MNTNEYFVWNFLAALDLNMDNKHTNKEIGQFHLKLWDHAASAQ